MLERDKMKFPRAGHSLAQLMSRFIYCIGSRVEEEEAARAVEIYNVQMDLWYDAPSLNEGRFYHSSTSFND